MVLQFQVNILNVSLKIFVQDRLFMSDYDRYLLALEEEIKKEKGERGKEGE